MILCYVLRVIQTRIYDVQVFKYSYYISSKKLQNRRWRIIQTKTAFNRVRWFGILSDLGILYFYVSQRRNF